MHLPYMVKHALTRISMRRNLRKFVSSDMDSVSVLLVVMLFLLALYETNQRFSKYRVYLRTIFP